jgi:hypothetical protein
MVEVEHTAAGWRLWAQAKRQEGERARRQAISDAAAAEQLAMEMSCPRCDVMIGVAQRNGRVTFAKPTVTHELSCPG